MTDTKLNDKTIGQPMVDDYQVDTSYDSNGQIKYIVTSHKFNSPIIIRKTQDGFSFYEVEMQIGHTASQLQGRFTRPDTALKEVIKYVKQAKVSKARQRDLNYEKNHGSASKPDNQELVQ